MSPVTQRCSTFGYTNADAAVLSTTQPIAGTTDDSLYQTQRLDPTEYRFDGLPSGMYEVELRFVETQPGPRLYDVSIENILVLSAHDVRGEVGDLTADTHVFFVTITDGQANVRLVPRKASKKPAISALRLVHRPELP